MRWLLRGVVGLVVAAGLGLGVVYVGSDRFFARRFDVEVAAPAVPAGPEAVARGRHFAEAVLDCAGCHGADLGGGPGAIDNDVIGHLSAPNLTRGRGGLGATFTAADWARAVRHGLARDGRALLFMSSDAYAFISNEDLGDLIAFLQALPPVDREVDPVRLGPVGRALFWSRTLPVTAHDIDHAKVEARGRVGETASADRGRYLAQTSGCYSCHGADLKGRTLGDVKSTISPAALTGWTRAEFDSALKEGTGRDGRALNAVMPSVRAFSRLKDDDVDALWRWAQGG
jgi:cytochrome c553